MVKSQPFWARYGPFVRRDIMRFGIPSNCLSAMVRLLVVIAWLFSLAALAPAQQAPPYRNAKLAVEERVADLLSRMTLEEKVAQMEGAWENKNFHKDSQTMFVDEKGNFVPERAAVLMKEGLGQISRPSEGRAPRQMAEYTN